MSDAGNPVDRAFAVATGTIQFCGQQRTFYFTDTPIGRATADRVFSGGSYPIVPFAGDVRTIFDVGANVGASTLYFAGNYPHARILAFEPFPESHDLLLRNVQGLSQISTFDFGLFDRDSTATLHLGLVDSATNSIVVGSETSQERQVLVKLRGARQVLAEQAVERIDILKLDTEGCELSILRSMADVIPRVRVIYIEFHHEADRREIDRNLSPTHMLVAGQIINPHRGELCYVLRELIPSEINAMAIQVQ